MNEIKYIAYYRASTEKQRDGLGLDVQQAKVETFVSAFGGTIVDSVTEIVSGGAAVREGFDKALQLCKTHSAVLLVHRIDRLSRAGFMTLAKLEEEGIPFIEADSPHDSQFSKNIKFLVAKEEKEKIQMRVKDAMAKVKSNIEENGFHITKEGKKIDSLGSPENLTDKARKRSAQVRRAKAIANENNRRAFAVIDRMRSDNSLAAIATYLNKHNFKTSRGSKFYPAQVANIVKLYEE